MKRKVIKGALYGFLGTYMSRYSEYDRYWLFGFLVSDLQHLRIDLLASTGGSAEDSPDSYAIALAKMKFRDQVAKARLSVSYVRAAELELVSEPHTTRESSMAIRATDIA